MPHPVYTPTFDLYCSKTLVRPMYKCTFTLVDKVFFTAGLSNRKK